MVALWIFYKESSYCHRFSNLGDQEITLGNQIQNTITLRSFPLETPFSIQQPEGEDLLIVSLKDEVIGTIYANEESHVVVGSYTLTFYFDPSPWCKKSYYIDYEKDIEISSSVNEDESPVCLRLVKTEAYWLLDPLVRDVYVNGERINGKHPLHVGDVIFYAYRIMIYEEEDIISLEGDESSTTLSLPPIKLPRSVLKDRYPSYRRTPRMIYDLPEDKIDFALPDREKEHSQRGLWFIILPPLVMLIVIGVIMMIRPRGIFVLMSITMFTMTIITSSVQYFRERKKVKEDNEKRKELYSKYLIKKRIELQSLSDKQREVLYYHFPDFEQMKYLTGEISGRIWERTVTSHDFLQVRVGRATVPSSYSVTNQQSEISNRDLDELLEKFQQLVSHFRKVKNVPLTIDLRQGAIGMIGREEVVKEEIRQIIGQLSFFQSYHDIRFVAIFDEEEYDDWKWLKWLPHFQLPHMYARGFIYNEKTRDQLLSSIAELLKERDLDEEKDKKLFTPYFIFIVTNRQLISEHAILSYLEREDQNNIGMSTIFAADRKESLTENINTLVRYIDDVSGDILIQNKKAKHTPFLLDKHSLDGNEDFARTLYSLDHELGMSHSIPEMVTFMEMFDVQDVVDLNIKQKWEANNSSKSLAVPVGLKSKDDLVFLNLHEKAHGPHGLLAGTTGSGKSEFLQAYILSLAVHFHPHEVAFLLIDYKGGGMAQPFRNMPHLLGTITNIEGSKNFSKRALESIKSELKNRQRLFEQFEVNHINDYMELYKDGMAKEPLPHLFIISDEFAELKSEEPEFIKELVSAARIGRSLGVHLILATQKPGGVIDNQIWSNSRFKVALKVQDESDSKEIIQNSDAAHITITGRGYLQVGNNEVYELFQSAWSGAPYEKNIVATEDEVALVTDLGLIPLSEVAAEDSERVSKRTEIDVVTEEIIKVANELKVKQVSSPWLPPLPEEMFRKEGADYIDPGKFLLALTDEPELQRQRNYYYEAGEDGNISIFGSSGYGKSMTVTTLLLSIARNKSPEEFHYYIFDFGNGALLPLRNLPHTADYFQSDEERKIEKFFDILDGEMERRKDLFREYEVSHVNLYNQVAPRKLPIIYIVIDNFDIVRDEMIDIENKYVQLSRDGQSLGIYMILTASRHGAVRHAMIGNFKTKIVHYLVDESEKNSIIGKTDYEIEPVPGRAYIRKDEAYLSQIYLPVSGHTDVEILENLKREVQIIQEKYADAKKPLPVPMLPRTLNLVSFAEEYELVKRPTLIPIGLDEEKVKPVYIDLDSHRNLLIVGDSRSGKTNILRLILHEILEDTTAHVAICDSFNRSLSSFMGMKQVNYIDTKEQLIAWVEQIEEKILRRETKYRTYLDENKIDELSFSPIVLMIDEMAQFRDKVDSRLEVRIADLLKNKSHLGFHFIATGQVNEMNKGFDPLTNEVKQVKQVILLMRKTDQTFVTLPYVRNEPELPLGFAYYIVNNHDQKILVPEYTLESEARTI